ncbi:conserved hypothetical protein [Perkinsus marinus ATCC 50983]|uniref:Uncharacterized protein n=1 Tax=Perkinsus marinus (strain ATCC 50983 / TXsc) TaxID=423536 RepID=C5KAX5_PERM5|nr:conserved hypothetical protein [Perkinsus marinus ATCC 50983]EER18301.1 conserved hypothetical protein [Perkinsus marinus ATCC 50983]|eukprot:XP_002786505.1 conserved hypothetical protein [Perkinsus marinus ATCC 50983]
MRERSRSKLVQRRIRETLLEKRYLPAISGEASYFTVPFTNPLSVEALYSVRVGRVGGDSNLTVERSRPCGLSLVTDPIEWRYIVKSRGFSEPNSGYELFTATAEFLLRPGQMVELPFRFLSLIESEADLIFEISIRRSGGEIARVVELVIPGPLGFLVDQVARCWELEGAAVRKTLSLAKEVETDASLVISPDDSGVSVTRANEQPRQLCISLMAPGAIERPREAVCLVYTRSDIYRERPMSVVRIICYALFGDYVKGVVGQPIHKAIKLPPQLHHGASSIVAYSTNSALAEIEPSHIRVPRCGPCHLPLSILPSISGMSTCLFFVAKDGEASAMGRPLVGWVLNIQAEPPTVTETHDLTLTYGQQSRKRLPFRNPLTRQTEFMMSSSNPDILQVS